MRLKTSAALMSMDAPVTLASVPAPSADIMFAMAKEGVLETLECMPSIEMKDAPPVDLAICMATPAVPDEGPGAEVRQQTNAVEAELRLRYAQEVATRAAIRFSSSSPTSTKTGATRRKRSFVVAVDDEHDANEDEQQQEHLQKHGEGEGEESIENDVQHKQKSPNVGGNVVPFRRRRSSTGEGRKRILDSTTLSENKEIPNTA